MRGRVISKNWGKLNVGQIVSIKEKQITTIEIRLFLQLSIQLLYLSQSKVFQYLVQMDGNELKSCLVKKKTSFSWLS